MVGWVVLAVLTASATLVSIALAIRVASGRAELVAVTTLVWFAATSGPVLALGYTSRLTVWNLVASAITLHATVWVAAAYGRTWADVFASSWCALVSMARVPIDVLRETLRARSCVVVGVVWLELCLGYALFETWRVPNVSWDSLIYHEPIIAFAIQNHGFAIEPLQQNATVQAINGYPRLVEATSIWFVILTDRTLVELPDLMAAPALSVVTYLLLRRYTDRTTAVGWAIVLLLVPQVWTQVCLVHVDVAVAFFAVCALVFVTRPVLRARDAAVALLAMVLLGASKISAVAMVPPLLLVLAVRLAFSLGRARVATTMVLLVTGTMVWAGVTAVPLVRNWRAFQDPFWPVDVTAFHHHWIGLLPLSKIVGQRPLAAMTMSMYDAPTSGLGDVIQRGYGYAVAWLVVPLAGLGLLALTVAWLKRRCDARGLGLVVGLTLVGMATTPTLGGHNARYNIHLVAGAMTLVVWMLSHGKFVRWREGIFGGALALSIVPMCWLRSWGWSFGATDDPLSFVAHPFGPHAYLDHATFDLLDRSRAAEIHAGDRVAFDQDVIFIGALWNFDASNEVRLVRYESPHAYLAALDTYGAKWAAAGSDDSRNTLATSPHWELVGKLTSEGDDRVYRRKR